MRLHKINKGYLLQHIEFEWVRLVMQLFICCYFDIVGVPFAKIICAIHLLPTSMIHCLALIDGFNAFQKMYHLIFGVLRIS